MQHTCNNPKTNRLSKALSPYLLQHSNNPIDWYEWSEEALLKAKNDNKPMIISIGYAACHWCHVMADESFMDQNIAEYMNKHFICIKVDREERPDIDRVYMNAANLLTGTGGWPLNVFTLPNGTPFFAGTYFPKENWISLLKQIVEVYQSKPDLVYEQADAISHRLKINSAIDDSSLGIKKENYINLYKKWESHFDGKHGGLNGAPKFPLPIIWKFLLQYYYLTDNQEVLEKVILFLNSMAEGGIYDQIGGGFARYSVDSYWKVPHFEKMLYDNAQLVSLYSNAYKVTPIERYSEIVQQTLSFIEKEMTSPEGGFYSSLNADSEGTEGKFYVWTDAEINRIIDISIRPLIKEYYQITKTGNWENGNNILFPKCSKAEFAEEKNLDIKHFEKILNKAVSALIEARDKRIRPSTDDKILTSWNAMMMSGYIEAYKAFGNAEYLNIAKKNAELLINSVVCSDGKLYRNYKDRKAVIDGFLDDYAFLSTSLIDLYGVTFDKKYLDLSDKLIRYTIKNFKEDDNVLFYYTSVISESLFTRDIEISDNVIPASNSVMANALFKIGHILNNNTYMKIAEKAVTALKDNIFSDNPYFANWAILAGLIIYHPYEISILGSDAAQKALELQKRYIPTTFFSGGDKENLDKLKGKFQKNKTILYVCHGKVCEEPTEHVSEAIENIK